VAWLVSDARVLASAEVAPDGASRRRGLLGRDELDGAFVIQGCRWVHTLGMRFAIDVAYLDDKCMVVKVTHMARHRLGLPVGGATWVVEASSGAFERWGLTVGDVVELRAHADEPSSGPPP